MDPFPKAWRAFLKANVFHYQLLNKAERKRLRNDAWTFVGRKDWEGCGGLSVTDEMKVTLAAQAYGHRYADPGGRLGWINSMLALANADEAFRPDGWLINSNLSYLMAFQQRSC